MTQKLFAFGLGYCAMALIEELSLKGGWRFAGTCRREEQAAELKAKGIEAVIDEPMGGNIAALTDALEGTTHMLISIKPNGENDSVLRYYYDILAALPDLDWIGYLSSTAVYGNHQGAWVDEETPPTPGLPRAKARLAAELAWQDFGTATRKAVTCFRIAGIYGPGRGRNQIDKIRSGRARRIIKPDHVTCRIHRDDIVQSLRAAISTPADQLSPIYNLCDDEPAPPQDVTAYACGLLGAPMPPSVHIDEADLSPMAASFYEETRRVSNRRLREELGVTLRYPTYKQGLEALAKNST
ncbi:MAG: NAD(P)-dependent oxidoreductase [Kordiimonas sp.]|nr:NAD(P)-dependent oxidoreductase [Kordiimonas sp.]|tara:strand:- start:69 stop:959 length:891 start_codon:yes stop_codon:yes gene_type:complete